MLPSKAKFLRFFGAVDPKGLMPRHDGRMSSWPPPPPPRPPTPSMVAREDEDVPEEPDPRDLPFLRRDLWVWAESGEPVGPVSVDQIARGILAGRVPLQAWVTRPGDPRWTKVLELRDIVRALELSSAVESLDPADSEEELVDVEGDEDDDDGIGEAIARAAAAYENESEVFPLEVIASIDVQAVDEHEAGRALAAREPRERLPSHDDDALTPPPYDASDAGTVRYKLREPLESDASEAGTGQYVSSDGRAAMASDPGADARTGEYDPPRPLRESELPPPTEIDPEPGTNPRQSPSPLLEASDSVDLPRPAALLVEEAPPKDEAKPPSTRPEASSPKSESIAVEISEERDGPVSTALAQALTRAADEGRWDVVLELARQLEARRPSPPAPDSTIFFLQNNSSVPPPPEHN